MTTANIITIVALIVGAAGSLVGSYAAMRVLVARLDERMKAQHERLEDVEVTLFGNGKEGLKSDVIRLEEWRDGHETNHPAKVSA